MFHIIIQQSGCVQLSNQSDTILINPPAEAEALARLIGDKRLLATAVTASQQTDIIDSKVTIAFVDTTTNPSALVTRNGKTVLYVTSESSSALAANCTGLTVDTILIDASAGAAAVFPLVQSLPKAGFVLPYQSKDTEAIELCRLVMLHHLGVPKYLKPGQYLVL